jgi:hypothetical protein
LTRLNAVARHCGTSPISCRPPTTRRRTPADPRDGRRKYLRSKRYYPWVGEGLAQVTWEENHRKFGATAQGQMMTWSIALKAIFDGMTKGMFGKS